MYPLLTKTRALLIALIAVATTLVAMPSANADPTPPVVVPPTEAVQRDVEAYAKTYRVSTDEALRRLQLQEVAGTMNARLTEEASDTFAGLYMEHKRRFRVVARFTRAVEQTLARYVRDTGLAGVAEARAAEVSLAALTDQQEAAYRAVRASGTPSSGSINLRENRVEIYVKAADRRRATDRVRRAEVSTPDLGEVTVISTANLPDDEVDVYGGLEITGGGALSTTGFTVRRSDGKTGVTAAGHAPNTGTVRTPTGPVATTFEAERAPSGPYDIQWHSVAGNTFTNVVRDSTSGTTRPITGVRLRASQAVGSSVCKYGRTTGYTCGTIASTTLCNNGSCTYVRVAGGSVNLSEGGDSGGPWFSGNTAYGTHCVGIGNDSGYMPVDYIEQGLGVSVVTGPSGPGEPPPPSPNGVSFFTDCSYGAAWRTLGVGSYVVQSANNLISSMRVPPGYRVTLFDSSDLTGASLIKTGDDSCLVDDGWNDRVSSLRIERT